MNRFKGSVMVGVFLAVVCMIATAARYEELFVTKLTVLWGVTTQPDRSIVFDSDNSTTITALPSSFYIVNPTGQASGHTNTVTLPAPTAAGKWVTFVVDSDCTNKMGIADSGTVKLSAAFAGDASDSITLVSENTSYWIEAGRSSN